MDVDTLAEVGRTLGLDASKCRALVETVGRIEQAIETHKRRQTSGETGWSRGGRNRKLRSLSQALSKLRDNIGSLMPEESRALAGIYTAMLGQQLSNAGIEAALGRRICWPDPSFRLFDSWEAESREGPYDELEREHYWEVRRNIASQHTAQILQGFLRNLQQRIDDFLVLERRRNKGGAPGRIYRNYAIAVLAEAFPDLFGAKPTASPNGQFCILCDAVLTELGESTDGLESAIQRVLDQIRS